MSEPKEVVYVNKITDEQLAKLASEMYFAGAEQGYKMANNMGEHDVDARVAHFRAFAGKTSFDKVNQLMKLKMNKL